MACHARRSGRSRWLATLPEHQWPVVPRRCAAGSGVVVVGVEPADWDVTQGQTEFDLSAPWFGGVYSLDASNGEELWRIDDAYAEEVIVVGDKAIAILGRPDPWTRSVEVMDARSGAVLWSYGFLGNDPSTSYMPASCLTDGQFLWTSAFVWTTAMSLVTGELAWTRSHLDDDMTVRVTACAGGTLYGVGHAHNPAIATAVVALDATTGATLATVEWSTATEVVSIHEDRLYVLDETFALWSIG